MFRCRLDIFPVELLHQIFSYLLAHEILRIFSNVSTYLDSILLSYSSYQLNLKSIQKSHFDLICHCLQPKQIFSLILVNDKDTPGQIQLFLSHYHMEDLIQLRHLVLINTELDSLELILPNLNHLHQLRSLLFLNTSKIKLLLSQHALQGERRLFDMIDQVLPQLNYLQLAHGNYLKSEILLPRLHHLIIARCSFDVFKRICDVTTELKSLAITLDYPILRIVFCFPLPHLIRLAVNMKDLIVTMDDMEQLLSYMPCLKHLELQVKGFSDLIDGYRWQRLTKHLITFNFNFFIEFNQHPENFDSFRTSFWLENKRWFVAYIPGRLYSIPHFADRIADIRFRPPPISTILNRNFFYDHIDEFKFHGSSDNWKRRFNQVQTLHLKWSVKLPVLQSLFNFTNLQRLVVSQYVSISIVQSILAMTTHLKHLSIQSNLIELFEQIGNMQMKQIRTLEIGEESNENNNWTIMQLLAVFPHIERLDMNCRSSFMNIVDLINGLKQLLSASFYYNSSSMTGNEKEKYSVDLKWAFNQRNNSFRFEQTYIHIWIGSEVNI